MGPSDLIQGCSHWILALNTEQWIQELFVFLFGSMRISDHFQGTRLGYQPSSNSLNTERWIPSLFLCLVGNIGMCDHIQGYSPSSNSLNTERWIPSLFLSLVRNIGMFDHIQGYTPWIPAQQAKSKYRAMDSLKTYVSCFKTWECVTIFQGTLLGYQPNSNSSSTERWIQ